MHINLSCIIYHVKSIMNSETVESKLFIITHSDITQMWIDSLLSLLPLKVYSSYHLRFFHATMATGLLINNRLKKINLSLLFNLLHFYSDFFIPQKLLITLTLKALYK